jgi:hypothetical protein
MPSKRLPFVAYDFRLISAVMPWSRFRIRISMLETAQPERRRLREFASPTAMRSREFLRNAQKEMPE